MANLAQNDLDAIREFAILPRPHTRNTLRAVVGKAIWLDLVGWAGVTTIVRLKDTEVSN